MHSFPDPLGLGSTLSLSLTLSAEFLCALLVVIGLFTRYVAFPLVFAMGVAFFVIHRGDPFQKKEMAFLYLMAFSTIFACGPGAYSADKLFRGIR
ncbi:MAG: DoxX family protein, partial [Myxococcales bacterium]|nr:DoxX family protein [Myxococcales bacterium]